jgi:hypothetical protein
MTLRIRFPQGRLVRRQREQHRELAAAVVSLITPTSLMAFVLAFWRLAADIGVARESGMRGVFSHWQLWLVLGIVLQASKRPLVKRLDIGEELDQATR